jgi:hypothetical protein
MKNTRFILVFLKVLVALPVISQESEITNVDTNYLSPKWVEKPLAVSAYRNGKALIQCENVYDFFSSKKNNPQYFVKSINGEDIYFYNQRAIISDGDTLVPKGYKIPSKNDYIKLIKENNTFLKKMEINGYIDHGFYDLGDLTFLWTADVEGAGEKGIALKVSVETIMQFELSPIPADFGCPVYYIENLKELIKDSIFEYKKLLPETYFSTVDKMFSNVKSHFDQNSEFIVSVSGSVENSRNGEFKFSLSKIDPLIGKINENKLRLSLSSTLSEWNTVPYYKGNILMANSDFQLTFKRTVTESNFWSPFKMDNVRNYSADNSRVLAAFGRGFTYKSNSETTTITDQGEIVRKETFSSVSKFKAPSQFNAALCLLPGLGVVSANRNSQSYRWKKVGKSFLISSISIGAISLSSKIYSNIYYSRYRYNPAGINANSDYKKANISQKVFLSTLGAYAFLGAMDFTFTFGIGVRNKKIEKDLNEQLKIGRQIILK